MPSNETKVPAITAWASLEASASQPIDCLQKLHALIAVVLHHDPDQQPDADELLHLVQIMDDLLRRLDSGLCELQEVRVAA